jgi:hypothetical protein
MFTVPKLNALVKVRVTYDKAYGPLKLVLADGKGRVVLRPSGEHISESGEAITVNAEFRTNRRRLIPCLVTASGR